MQLIGLVNSLTLNVLISEMEKLEKTGTKCIKRFTRSEWEMVSRVYFIEKHEDPHTEASELLGWDRGELKQALYAELYANPFIRKAFFEPHKDLYMALHNISKVAEKAIK